ncbi:MAG: hypothetical protein KA479_10445, partial [Saprospiraceae bacterium]|nr:hypothetical protein [Saprospiraceae bacterium]
PNSSTFSVSLHPMSFTKQLTAITLGLVLLISTTGIPVHALYCICKGEWSVSFYTEAEMSQCDTGEDEGDACCGGAITCCSTTTAADAHNCDSEETLFAKLNTVFLSQLDNDLDGSPNVSLPFLYPFPTGSKWVSDILVDDQSARRARFRSDRISGPSRHVLYQQFRC